MNDPITGYMRVKVVCLFLNGDRLLAIDAFDPTRKQRFWVPIGGRVEFGETSRQAIVREVQEELSAEITDLRLLGVLENLFTFDGEDGHEIVFVYDGRFADESMYAGGSLTGREANNISFAAHWIHPFDPDHDRPLYPDGLQELVRSDSA